jgi:hypothetical protein
MKQYKDALTKIAELVGYKFNNEVTKVEFERVALEGGEVFISNQSEGELTLGDTIYIETEEGFELAPSGTHRLDDNREIVLDEESTLVEIREEPSEEEEVVVEESSSDEEMSEETESTEDFEETNRQITELKEAIHDLLLAFNTQVDAMNERFNVLENDYNQFKKSESIPPLKQETKLQENFSDWRVGMINKLKENKKY